MDFLKACTTNVHVIKDIFQYPVRQYKWPDDQGTESDTWCRIHHTLARLRQQNVLCTVVDDEIWVFGEVQEEQKSILDAYVATNEDTVQNHRTSAEGQRHPVALFDAIESAIAYCLADDTAMTHIAPWTWLYCAAAGKEDDEERVSLVVKLHATYRLTGTLYLVPVIEPTSWMPLPNHSHVDAETEIILAPHGRSAHILSSSPDNARLGDDWQSLVASLLETEGVSVPLDAQWISIHMKDEPGDVSMMWPRSLCVEPKPFNKLVRHCLTNEREWQGWFTKGHDENAFRNPLALAEQWIRDAEQQQRTSHEADSGAEAVSATPADAAGDSSYDSNLITSPPFTQRSIDQQTAMAGVYPTPPDALTQGAPGVQVNIATTPTVAFGDSGSGGDLVPSVHDETLPKQPETGLPDGNEDYQMGQEDLFGEVGGMEFEENEIGDADFSFFDEPDEDAMPVSIDESRSSEVHPSAKDEKDLLDPIVDDAQTAPMNDVSDPPSQGDPQDALGDTDNNTTTTAYPSIDIVKGDLSIPSPVAGPRAPPPEKPLSPFGIRERLLPPPVPASIAQSDQKDSSGSSRRNSNFSPIAFRHSSSTDSRYFDDAFAESKATTPDDKTAPPNISLPSIRKKSRVFKPADEMPEQDSESEEDSYESSSSTSDVDLPPRLPWDNSRKRKRYSEPDSTHSLAEHIEQVWSDKDEDDEFPECPTMEALSVLKDHLLSARKSKIKALLIAGDSRVCEGSPTDLEGLQPLNVGLYNLRKDDLIYVAQIISEQATTAVAHATSRGVGLGLGTGHAPTSTSSTEDAVRKAFENVLPSIEFCDVGMVALSRESPQSSRTSLPAKTQGQPRPSQRAESTMTGPDYIYLPPPFVRVQRAADTMEMLPSCLPFWETLGLGPASGGKNVRAVCVYPNNEDLRDLVGRFMTDMGSAYESCKLGSHIHHRDANGNDTLDGFEDGLVPVELADDVSIEATMEAYANTCEALGKALALSSRREAGRTTVVYMIDLFAHARAKQHLSACFWLLFKAYRENAPRDSRNTCGSDVVLQLIPISMVASYDVLVVPDAHQLGTLAHEVYDRCPPSPSAHSFDMTSPLPILAAPSVELASLPPKRIAFQLAAEPPGDLLHEGSILHLAYATSKDGLWLTAAWVDNTGQYQSSSSFCLRGRSFAEVVEEVWECTREILNARKVTWRVFIATNEFLDEAKLQHWRMLCIKPRAHPLCVTMLSVQSDPVVQFSPPPTTEPHAIGQDTGFLTPASTPQAGGTLTSSPAEISNNSAAPPTPAPSEAPPSLVENDPDAHLVDLTDETWAILYTPNLKGLTIAQHSGLANGALFKRGNDSETTSKPLPSLGVSLHWTMQIKAERGGVDEGSIKQAEVTLREVLRMYRSLGVLTRARGLDLGEGAGVGRAMAPVHLAVAILGARALDGMLAT